MRKNHLFYLLIFVLVLIFVFVYIHSTAHTNLSPGPAATAMAVKVGSSSLYPNSKLTPGVVLTTDATTVCEQGYSKSVRNVPIEEKKQVYAEYGIPYPQPQGSYEVDHFISLELGGSNDITNLWPEPSDPKPGFHEKDAVENYLHAQVCNGQITLQQAQQEISTDWYAVYLKIVH